ncbi:hypothetical protein F5X99DRAFT_384637 [Biscogniauxia marginata]|nr:hypothetical protein F5X99DRAFT_384637 [Biscogniauxia marginata]
MAISPILDHVTILVSHVFLNDPPLSLREVFNLTSAGRQGDGQTERVLAHFEDGTYLEFIAFRPDIDPEARRKHRYGECEEGTVVDWAIRFTPPEAPPEPNDESWEEVFDAMQLRVRDSGTGVIYLEPVRVSTRMPDGTESADVVSFPDHGGHLEWKRELDVIPGEVPYWVLRSRPGEEQQQRSPPTAEAHDTRHPSGAAGLAGVEVRIRAVPERVRSEHRLGLLWETFQTLFGGEPADVVDEGRRIDAWEWRVGVPVRANPALRQRLIRLVAPEHMVKNVEVRVDLLRGEGEVARLELDASKSPLQIRLGPQTPPEGHRQNYQWAWMK